MHIDDAVAEAALLSLRQAEGLPYRASATLRLVS